MAFHCPRARVPVGWIDSSKLAGGIRLRYSFCGQDGGMGLRRDRRSTVYFAPPGFGIRAKRSCRFGDRRSDFAPPGCGERPARGQ